MLWLMPAGVMPSLTIPAGEAGDIHDQARVDPSPAGSVQGTCLVREVTLGVGGAGWAKGGANGGFGVASQPTELLHVRA